MQKKELRREGALRVVGQDLLLYVFAKPRASKNRILKLREGELEVALNAPPVEGAANAELCKFVARVSGLPKSRVLLVKGEASRHKILRLYGASFEEVFTALGL